MNEPRISSRDFRAALARLREGLAEDPTKSGLVVDGVIQRFEFTFELAWKLLKAMLWREGIDCRSPRACVKEAFQQGMIHDGEGWIAMLEDRNRTSHLYDEKEALTVYRAVTATYVALFDALEEMVSSERYAGA
jgi:nucleotidyltransferase substrate binding protein (TIGR01987 family)